MRDSILRLEMLVSAICSRIGSRDDQPTALENKVQELLHLMGVLKVGVKFWIKIGFLKWGLIGV